MKRKLVTLLLAGVLSVSAMACASSNNESEDQAAESTSEDAAQDSDAAIMEKYTQLENGMSYDEVKETMGSDGEDITSEDDAENVKVYQWTSEDTGATITVTFEDDKAVSFGQEGFE